MESEVNPCEPINNCSDADDYRPIQSTLLTRFALAADCSDSWRTTNQDYGAFYYRNALQHCVPDGLKAKIQRRHSRFQDWMLYQTKCQQRSSSASNNQAIFPSNRNQTVRITHRKKFLPNCDSIDDGNAFSPCSEDGLVNAPYRRIARWKNELARLDHRIHHEEDTSQTAMFDQSEWILWCRAVCPDARNWHSYSGGTVTTLSSCLWHLYLSP